MKLYINGPDKMANSKIVANHKIRSDQIIPLVKLYNSSLQHISGSGIHLVITNSVFFNNSGTVHGGQGGVIFIGSNSRREIISCIFKNHTCRQGGVLSIQHNTSALIVDSIFSENTANIAGVINTRIGVTLYIKRCVFEKNYATGFGGVIGGETNTNITISQSTFSQNAARIFGGIIYAKSDVTIMLFESNMCNNTALKGSVFYISKNSYLYVYDTELKNHTSNLIYIKSSEMILDSCTFSNNSLMLSFLRKVIVTEISLNLVIKSCSFTHNKVHGILYSTSSPLFIKNNTFIQNIAFGDGFIYTQYTTLVINESLFLNNTVKYGHGIQFDKATITYSNFTENFMCYRYGLIASRSEHEASSLDLQMVENYFQLTYCYYACGVGELLNAQDGVDIAIDKCTFRRNCGLRIIYLSNDGNSLRTSNSTIISKNSVFHYAIFFDATETMTKMTDYMTYNTLFIHGNVTLNTSLTKNFTEEALNEGIVAIYHPGTSYYVSQEETLYASGIVNYHQHYLECDRFTYSNEPIFTIHILDP